MGEKETTHSVRHELEKAIQNQDALAVRYSDGRRAVVLRIKPLALENGVCRAHCFELDAVKNFSVQNMRLVSPDTPSTKFKTERGPDAPRHAEPDPEPTKKPAEAGRKTLKEKSLPMAIGLNVVLPGVGYMYMDKPVLGVVVFLFAMAAAWAGAVIYVPVWLFLNVVMAIDMILLNTKRDKAVALANTMQCPFCAERIQKEAKICRWCRSRLDDVNTRP